MNPAYAARLLALRPQLLRILGRAGCAPHRLEEEADWLIEKIATAPRQYDSPEYPLADYASSRPEEGWADGSPKKVRFASYETWARAMARVYARQARDRSARDFKRVNPLAEESMDLAPSPEEIVLRALQAAERDKARREVITRATAAGEEAAQAAEVYDVLAQVIAEGGSVADARREARKVSASGLRALAQLSALRISA